MHMLHACSEIAHIKRRLKIFLRLLIKSNNKSKTF